MTAQSPTDPLHGVTLKLTLTDHTPSISSSLKFLRRTTWARDKVEELYLRSKI